MEERSLEMVHLNIVRVRGKTYPVPPLISVQILQHQLLDTRSRPHLDRHNSLFKLNAIAAQ